MGCRRSRSERQERLHVPRRRRRPEGDGRAGRLRRHDPRLRAWFADHPDRFNEIADRNRSKIFFRIAERPGAVGSQGVTLTPGRSLAVDRAFVAGSTPVWVDTRAPVAGARGTAPSAARRPGHRRRHPGPRARRHLLGRRRGGGRAGRPHRRAGPGLAAPPPAMCARRRRVAAVEREHRHSCVGHHRGAAVSDCADASPFGCYCDERCSETGDCCPDLDEVCGVAE